METYGFSISSEESGTTFGVVNASSEEAAQEDIETRVGIEPGETLEIMPVAELLDSQYEDLAFLTTERDGDSFAWIGEALRGDAIDFKPEPPQEEPVLTTDTIHVQVYGGPGEETKAIASICHRALIDSGFQNLSVTNQKLDRVVPDEPISLIDHLRETRPHLFSKHIHIGFSSNKLEDQLSSEETLALGKRVLAEAGIDVAEDLRNRWGEDGKDFLRRVREIDEADEEAFENSH